MRLGSYTRLSKDHQGTETATKRQQKAIDDWAKAQGHRITARYRDSDLSASKAKVIRPDFQRLLGDLEQGTIEGVAVWRTDRFTRRPIELERFLEMADRTGARLFSVTEPFDNSAMGTFALRFFVNNHALESAVRSERLKAKAEELALAGKIGSGTNHRPLGYERDQMTVREDEAEMVRTAVARVLAGESLYAVCQDWARSGYTTDAGRHWAPEDLGRTLSAPRMAGLREHLGKVTAPAVWPAIITPAQREALIAVLAARKRGPSANRFVRKYLLSGILVCSRCETPMVGQRRSDGVGSYLCFPSAITGGCGKMRIVAPQTDKHVSDGVISAWENPKIRRRLQPLKGTPERPLVAQVEAQEAKLEELATMWAAGELTSREWTTARKSVEERLEFARRRLTQLRAASAAPIIGRNDSVAELWERADIHQKRALTELVLEKVYVLPAKAKGGRWDSARLDPRWRPTSRTSRAPHR